jgi:hypothetical protein
MALSVIPGIPITCVVNLPANHVNFPGLIALGPSRSERDILYNCCHTLQTELFSVNDTACLQTAVCRVGECSLNDASYACVALLRQNWKVEGAFACVEGARESRGAQAKARMVVVWVAISVLLGALGNGGL